MKMFNSESVWRREKVKSPQGTNTPTPSLCSLLLKQPFTQGMRVMAKDRRGKIYFRLSFMEKTWGHLGGKVTKKVVHSDFMSKYSLFSIFKFSNIKNYIIITIIYESSLY